MKLRSAGHNVYFETDSFSYLEEFLHENLFSSVFILCDRKTKKFCLPFFLEQNPSLRSAKVLVIEPGEKHKNLSTLTASWNFLLTHNADRRSLLICLGGGVVCDLGGFAASTFKRGIQFIHVPTTLLAMADASVGGKTGIDFRGFKNIIGTITQPQGVFIYDGFLETLPLRQLNNGMAEIIKAALIGDVKLWRKLRGMKKLPARGLSPFIRSSVKVKNDIVVKDPNERNVRKALNFGHTAGHAIETYFINRKNMLLHGEAVVMGMCVELCLGKIMKHTDTQTAFTAFVFLKKQYKLKRFSEKEVKSLMGLMKQDKKNHSGQLNFALIDKIAKPVINVWASPIQVTEAFTLYNNLLK